MRQQYHLFYKLKHSHVL